MIIIQIAGHLGADPETRISPSGLKVTTLRIATNVYQNGKDETVWWRVTLWGTEFDKIMPYIKKGTALFVVGEMSKPEIYNDREGRPQISLNLTARLLRLSPFGKNTNQEGRSGGYAGEAKREEGGYTRYGNTPATSTFDEMKGSQEYQSAYGGMSTDGYSETEEKEETIPF
jgi:single-strand DNA-binding protein